MSTAQHTFSFDQAGSHGYLDNLGRAARALLAALFAVQPRSAASQNAERERAETASYLSRMANQYEHVAPNLSAELRFMASRG